MKNVIFSMLIVSIIYSSALAGSAQDLEQCAEGSSSTQAQLCMSKILLNATNGSDEGQGLNRCAENSNVIQVQLCMNKILLNAIKRSDGGGGHQPRRQTARFYTGSGCDGSIAFSFVVSIEREESIARCVSAHRAFINNGDNSTLASFKVNSGSCTYTRYSETGYRDWMGRQISEKMCELAYEQAINEFP